jgi:galactose mutarotase-like enzyme
MVAELVPDAGMVCCSLTVAGAQLLDLTHGLEAYATRGATMGIPLLYPWANRLAGSRYEAAGRSVLLPDDGSRVPRDGHGLPIHGVMPGLLRWSPAPRTDGDAQLAATLAWTSPDLLALFPFAHEVSLALDAHDDALTVAVTVRATADTAVPISFGFHPYLRLPSGSRTSWRVELPSIERLVLDQQMIPTGARTAVPPTARAFELADTSWDDGFSVSEQPARFAVSSDGWEVALELLEGYPFAQIFAPPGRDFICFEPMTAPANALRSGDALPVLGPGEEYRAVFRIRVRRP